MRMSDHLRSPLLIHVYSLRMWLTTTSTPPGSSPDARCTGTCVYHYTCTCRMTIEENDVPSEMRSIVDTRRHELIETVANIDEPLGEIFLSDRVPTSQELMVWPHSDT